ncbi:hypothetical protein CLOP_g15672 [Closterium sp. NIES-67]|nr:hypothetical protein CLOP_g15672 [Closterium sp. NIES-67]
MHELEATAGWVYECAFSDDEGEDGQGGTDAEGKRDGAGCAAAVGGPETAEDSKGVVPGGKMGESERGEAMAGGSSSGEEAGTGEKGRGGEKHESGEERGEGASGQGGGGKGKMGRGGEGEEVCGWHVFYQAQDGPCVVLHPLNFKCLLQHYGSVERLPLSITARVLQLEAMRQSEAVRRRLRVLDHLPLTAAFVLAEVDLAPLLPASSLAPFLPEINQRRLQRQRLLRQEERDRVKAQHREAVAVAAAAEDARFFERQRVPAPMDFVPLAQAVAAGSATPGAATPGAAGAAAPGEDSDADPVAGGAGGDVAAGGAESEGAPSSVSHAPPMAFSKVAELGYAAGLGSVALSSPSPALTHASSQPLSSLSAASTPAPPAAGAASSVWANRPDFSKAGPSSAAGAAAAGWGRGAGSGGEGSQAGSGDGGGASGGGKGKGKKGKKKGTTILLSSGGLPRY